MEHAIVIASDTEFRLIIWLNYMTSYHNTVRKIAITKVGHLTWPVSVCYHSCIKSKSTKFLIMYTLQKMPFLNCVTVTQIMCKHGFLHAILRQNYIKILIRDDV